MKYHQMLGLLSVWLDRVRTAGRDESGSTLVEYGLLVALIAVVVMATLTVMGVRINALFCSVVGTLGGTC